jgi:hypothetical protein
MTETYRQIKITTEGPHRADAGPFPRNDSRAPYWTANGAGSAAIGTTGQRLAILCNMAGDTEDQAIRRVRRHIDRQLRGLAGPPRETS